MYRTNFAFLILILIVFVSCLSTRKQTNQIFTEEDRFAVIDSLISNHKIFDTYFIEKGNFRFGYHGQLKTLKYNLSIKKDEFIYIKVYTNLGIQVIEFLANPTEIFLTDNQEKIIYSIDYKTLQHFLSFPICFKELQAFLTVTQPELYYDFLKDDLTSFIIEPKSTYLKFIHNTSPDSTNQKYFNSLKLSNYSFFTEQFEILNTFDHPFFTALYTWSKKLDRLYPNKIEITTSYSGNPLDIEMENKVILFDTPVTFHFDSTLKINRVIIEE